MTRPPKGPHWETETQPDGSHYTRLRDGWQRFSGYAHVEGGFVLTHCRKVHVRERDARLALLRKEMKQRADEINKLQEFWKLT